MEEKLPYSGWLKHDKFQFVVSARFVNAARSARDYLADYFNCRCPLQLMDDRSLYWIFKVPLFPYPISLN